MDSETHDHLRAEPRPSVWFAVRIAFRERTLRTCNGGFLDIGGERYLDRDPVYGRLAVEAPVTAITDGTDEEAARVEIAFEPPIFGVTDELWLDSDGEPILTVDEEPILIVAERSAMEHAEDPGMQLSPVTVFWGSIDPETGQVIGDPEGSFNCLTDVPSQVFSSLENRLTLDCCSILDWALQALEGLRLNGALHKSIWPGELGLDNHLAVTRRKYWGQNAPRGSITFPPGSIIGRWTGGRI